METPLVSVIIPVYNVERYLERCLQSVAGQTYRNLQILLIDDGSSDRSGRICDDWAAHDDRIQVIHKVNAGAGVARNTGLERASGEYILFVDSDDYINVETIEHCVNRMLADPVDVLIFGKYNAHKDGAIHKIQISDKKCRFSGTEIADQIIPAMFTYDLGFGISVWGKFYARKAIEIHHIRFLSEREVGSEDALFNLNLFVCISDVGILPENLYYYFENQVSFSRKYRADRQEKNDVFLEKCMTLSQKCGLSEHIVRHIQVRYHGYTFAALKQIMISDLSRNMKKAALQKVYNSSIMRSTLRWAVISMEKKKLRLFWGLVKIRCFWLCNFLLWYKSLN